MKYAINKQETTREEVEKLCKLGELEFLEQIATGIFNNGGYELVAKMTEEIDISITQ